MSRAMSVDRRGYVVRLRGLPFTATAIDVIQFLSAGTKGSAISSSEIEVLRGVDGVVFTFSPDGKPNGEALVELKDEMSMRMAMKRHKEMMGNRYIELVRTSCCVTLLDRLTDESHTEVEILDWVSCTFLADELLCTCYAVPLISCRPFPGVDSVIIYDHACMPTDLLMTQR